MSNKYLSIHVLMPLRQPLQKNWYDIEILRATCHGFLDTAALRKPALHRPQILH